MRLEDLLRPTFALTAFLSLFAAPANAQQEDALQNKPNILVIWGDDVGVMNISAYHNGLMGGSTPNIDRIAKEGALFTDAYAQQGCTAGRAAFLLGQHPFRSGLLTTGMPGSEQGMKDKDPTIAELLKPHGYVSGQFGKHHLGDRDEHLPTRHGFDEFFGNLHPLVADVGTESAADPGESEPRDEAGPRGVLRSFADGRIEDTGALTEERMETVDDEFLEATIDFIERAHHDGKPFFVWHNPTRMHVGTRLPEEYKGKSGYGVYADGMMQLDDDVGALLATLEELGILDDTIVVFSTDNGADKFNWPEGGTTPFRGEKGTTWEGGFRVPQMIRWPGVVEPGAVINDIFSHEDWMPTLLAAAGEPDVKGKLLKGGHRVSDKRFKAHLDGYDQTALLKGEGPGAREEIFYFDAAGNLNALRHNEWKFHWTIMERSINETYRVTPSRPLIINLRMDPYEASPDSANYTQQYYPDHVGTFEPAQAVVQKFLDTFKEFPPAAGNLLSVEHVLRQLPAAPGQ